MAEKKLEKVEGTKDAGMNNLSAIGNMDEAAASIQANKDPIKGLSAQQELALGKLESAKRLLQGAQTWPKR